MQQQPNVQQPVTPPTVEEPTPSVAVTQPESQPAPKPQPTASGVVKKIPQKRASAFSLSQLSSQINQKREEEQKKQAEIQEVAKMQEEEELSLDATMQQNVYDAWYSLEEVYRAEAATSLETAIAKSKIKYENNLVEITVVGKIAQSMLEERYTFIIDYIKEKTKLPFFNFKIVATDVKVDDVKTYTKEEQLEYLMKNNPAIEQLVRGLKLEIDYNNNDR